MAADAQQDLRAEIATLRRILADFGRFGTVKKSEKGRTRVSFGQGDGGDDGGDLGGVWIRTDHGGAQSSSETFAEGETVAVLKFGGSAEHSLLIRAGFSDSHPRDGNAADDNSTRRWRKPPEKSEDQQQASSGGGDGQYANGKSKGQKWKDSEDDHQETNSHDKRKHALGKYSYEATKDGGVQKYDKMFSRVTKDGVEIGTGDEAHFVYKDGKLTIKCPIVDKNGKKFAVEGSIDTRGDTLVSGFANE